MLTFLAGKGYADSRCSLFAVSESDDYGTDVGSNPDYDHDFHATILRLMVLNHERLTYRLTDVAGRVAKPLLA